jgi:GNAT superfamily N-acetyltransferase
MSQLQIQVYSDIYKQEVIDLIINIQQNEFNIPINLAGQPDLNQIPDFYQTGSGNFWIATIDQSVVGTIGLLDIRNSTGALRKMFVDNRFRGKQYGVGQALLNALLGWASEKKITEIFLGTTEKFTAAQKFYERNGFEEIEKQSLPKEFPIMSVDIKFYRFTV